MLLQNKLNCVLKAMPATVDTSLGRVGELDTERCWVFFFLSVRTYSVFVVYFICDVPILYANLIFLLLFLVAQAGIVSKPRSNPCMV